MIIEILGRMQ